MKRFVSCLVSFVAMGLTVVAGPVVDIGAQMRSGGVSMGVVASTVSSGLEGNVVDGNEGSQLQFGGAASQWLEMELPVGWQSPVYVTGMKIVWGHLNSCAKEGLVQGWDTEAEKWVELGTWSTDVTVWNTSLQFAGVDVKAYPKYRIELVRKAAWNYVIKEVYVYGRAGDVKPPLGKVMVASENAGVAETLSHALGEHLYVPAFPQQLDIFTAAKMVDREEEIALCQGFVLEKSVDAGETWLAAVTNLDVYAYNYAAVADEWIRLMWLYTTQAKVKGDFYVDGTSGVDAAGNCHVETLADVPEVLQNGKTVYLGAGVFTVSEEVLLNGFGNVTFEGVGMDATVVEVAEGATSRHFRLQNCTNVEFKNMTFRGGSIVGSDSVYGASVYAADSTNVKFTSCSFVDNLLSTTANVGSGGAITTVSTSLALDGCVFERNSVVAPRAFGGAISVLTMPNSPAGVIACTNTVFRKNYVEGSEHARGLAVSFSSDAGGEFVNCLAVLNKCRSANAVGTAVFASRAYEMSLNSTYQGTGFENNAEGSDPIVIRNSTVAYNQANAVVSAGQGVAVIEHSVIRGQRSVADRFNWYNITIRDTFYDFCVPNVATITDCSQEDPLMGPDFRLAARSPAAGYGYTFTEPSSLASKTVYVDPSAAAGGTGAKGRPFQSLTEALSVVGVGDTIELAAGRYTSATEVFPIVIEDTEFVTIRGAGAGETVFSNGLAEEGTLAFRVQDNFGLVLRDFSVEDHRNVEVMNEPSAIQFFGGVRNELVNVTVSGCERLPAAGCDVKAGHVDIQNVQGMIVSGLRIENSLVQLKGGGSSLSAGVFRMGGTIGLLEKSAFVNNQSAASTVSSLVFSTSGGRDPSGYSGDSDVVGYVEHRNLLVAGNELVPGVGYTSSVERNGDLFYGMASIFENCTFIGTRNAKVFSWNSRMDFRNCIFQGVKGFNAVTASNTPLIYTFENCVVVTDEVNTEAAFAGSVSPESTGVVYTTNVGFRNPAEGKYTFVGDSPAVDIGTLLPWMSAPDGVEAINVDWRGYSEPTDLAGKPRVSNKFVDAGCYEYQLVQGLRIFIR